MKTCTKCNIVKDYSEFGRDKQKPDGHRPDCKACRNSHQRSTYCVEEAKARSARKQACPDHRLQTAITNARVKARKEGYEFSDFNREDLLRYWESEGIDRDNCYLCGVTLSSLPTRQQQIDHVEELDLGGAHVVENVRPCCGDCNIRKSVGVNPRSEQFSRED